MHVRGFTRHPSSGVGEKTRGTYAGLIEKIPYLQQLGVTAVELLPVFQFDAQDCPPGRVNYWGYAPIALFAPHQAYSSCQAPLGPADEFRDMVKALHRAGIEVILDVVFNHTTEGDHNGPALSFCGIDNRSYYILEDGGGRYANYSGCGNTLNANHPVVRRLIVDCLRYWVREMHVDGFRFDLASILARDASGRPLPNPPVLWDIESDPSLAGTKLIAEAWQSVNFVTCHDGFTLNDLVSYNQKHNEANGEDNRDGANDNRSWNCGAEGPTDDPAVERLRNRQVKNHLAVTMMSLGVPMILMGDEFRHTQRGNNNAYCHDNEISWLDWTRLTRHADVHRFARLLIARRLLRDAEPERRRLTLNSLIRQAHLAWHGVKLDRPDWGHDSHCVALGADSPREGLLFHFILNAYWEPLDFELPGLEGGAAWRRWIDTALDSPDDIVCWDQAPPLTGTTYRVADRSVVVLYTTTEVNSHRPA
jgi:glycogen operon protein